MPITISFYSDLMRAIATLILLRDGHLMTAFGILKIKNHKNKIKKGEHNARLLVV